MQIVTSISRAQVAQQRADREAELQRLALLAVTKQGKKGLERVSDLLAFLGVIHDTPHAKRNWMDRIDCVR